MTTHFDRIKNLYRSSYLLHGESPASLLTPKGRNNLRFRVIDQFISKRPLRILDYGCGLGYLLEYLNRRCVDFTYVGLDLLQDFIDACNTKFPRDSFQNSSFMKINPFDEVTGNYDIVFASGVFNIRTHHDENESKSYAYERIKQLFAVTDNVLVCDFLSPYVDFRQDDSQHFSIDQLADFAATNLSRRFQIRHDLLPYEFSIIAWKDSVISRPQNIYQIDA